MAIFRKVHTSFWTDPFVENLTDKQKLFYLYLITNTKTKQCGIYEISKKFISYETGFSVSEVNELLNYFISINKIIYSEKTNEIGIINWYKYNWSDSPKTIACIKKELLEVKDTSFIEHLYSTDKLSIVYPYSINTSSIEYVSSIDTQSQQEEEKEKQEEEAQVKAQVEAQVEAKAKKETIDEMFSGWGIKDESLSSFDWEEN